MPVWGLGLSLVKLVTLMTGAGTVFPSSIKLKDTDSSDWFEITLEPNPGGGFYLEWVDTPVAAGTVDEWILEAPSNGIRYRWGFQRFDGILSLEMLGTTLDPVTPVEIRSSNGLNRRIVGRHDGTAPYLDFV